MKKTFALFILSICTVSMAQAQTKEISYAEQPPFHPATYVCYKTPAPITVDGKIAPGEWDTIPWMSDFTDITGDKGPKPHLQTKAKMTHDDNGLYIAVWLEEPHIWATITQHDATIFQDNAFELFFNPSNDTHHYLEYEVNALGTVWDLYLSRPYRDNPVTFNNWEFIGMQSAVSIDGTLNNPDDTDKAWSIEVFIPWRSLYQVMPRTRKPAEGAQMRTNLMRVQWPLDIIDGKYLKAPKKEGRRSAESHWLWSPIGISNVHLPEYWGYVQFTEKTAGTANVPFVWNPDEDIKWILRNLYYRQSEYNKAFGAYTSQLSDLKPEEVCPAGWVSKLALYTTPSLYEITLTASDGKVWHIRQDGLVWDSK